MQRLRQVGAASLTAILALLPLSGFTVAAQEAGAGTPPEIVPGIVPPALPQRPRMLETQPPFDIPQWAKDAGHNGISTWRVVVDAAGAVAEAQLVRSSGSEAIDGAARQYIMQATFLPGTGYRDDRRTTAEVRLGYARWDERSPGGGMRDYRCADLLREVDWFRANVAQIAPAQAERTAVFTLERYFMLGSMLVFAADNPDLSYAEVGNHVPEFEQQWSDIVAACRADPASLLRDRMRDPRPLRVMLAGF